MAGARRTPAPACGAQRQQALGAGGPGDGWLRTRPEQLGLGVQVQQVAIVEIDEQEAAARILEQVAEGIEQAVAGIVGQPQAAIRAEPEKARRPAPMGDVDAASERVGMLAGDEQRIAARDQRQPAWIESFALQRGTCDPGDGLMAARLDVLGTVSEGLLDADRETLSVPRQDPSIHAVAAAGRPFQAEDAEAGASLEIGRQRIVRLRQVVDAQAGRFRRTGEAGGAPEHRGAGVAVGVEAAHQQQR